MVTCQTTAINHAQVVFERINISEYDAFFAKCEETIHAATARSNRLNDSVNGIKVGAAKPRVGALAGACGTKSMHKFTPACTMH